MGEGAYFHIEELEDALELWFSGGSSKRIKPRPYFYILPEEEGSVTGFLEKERVRRKVMGLERELIKLYFKDERSMKRAIRALKNPIEAGLPAWLKYVLDEGLVPFSTPGPEGGKGGGMEDLRKLFFSGIVYSEDGFPIEGKSPLVAISYAIDEGPVEVIHTADLDDSSVIREFSSLIVKEDPDVLIGYGQDADEFKHIMGRARSLGIRFQVGRDGSEPVETGKFFRGTIIVENRIRGRANLDLFSVAWRDFPYLPERTWYELADELGVERPKVMMKFRIADAWKHDKDATLSYLKRKLNTIIGIYSKVIDYQVELSRMSLIPIHRLLRSSVGEIVEAILLREARSRGWVASQIVQKAREDYEGGFVWMKSPGIYEDICYLDFASMYPSIMILHNISFETVDPHEGLCGDLEEVSVEGVKARVCRDKRGLVPGVVEKLMEERYKVKESLRKLKRDDVEYRRLEAAQKAIKVVTNAIYGYMGWESATFKNLTAARLTSAYGRSYIKKVKDLLESKGLDVIYVDTDGIQFIGGGCESVIDEVNTVLPLRLELRYKALRGIYLAKKKYAHILEDGGVIAKGLEFVRRDYPKIVKDAQREVVEMILKGEKDKVGELVERFRRRILEGDLEKEDLIMFETIGKEEEKFERMTKGLRVSLWLRENKGIELHRGQVLRIIIVKGPGSVTERARPAEFFDVEDADLGYYLDLLNQVMERTLAPLKVSEDKRGGLEYWF
ncbi:MAG: DNA-directed DNA polymerase [Candidatus Korarchaeum sp.]